MGSWVHGFIGSWVHGFGPPCVLGPRVFWAPMCCGPPCVLVPSPCDGPRGFIGSWVHGLMVNVMKEGMHKVQNPKRYEGEHAQSSIIKTMVQNIILPQIGLAQEMDTKTL